jgi:hypothetical protein
MWIYGSGWTPVEYSCDVNDLANWFFNFHE